MSSVPRSSRWEGFGMLGGGSDGAHNAPDYGEKQAIFMQFAGKVRAQSLHLV